MRGTFTGLIIVAAIALGGTSAGSTQVPSAALPPVQVAVTGDPAPVETLRLAILTTTRALVPEARTGAVQLAETEPPLQPLRAASEMALRAVVQVGPAGAKPPMTVPVAIKNQATPWADAQALLVSNSPETLPFGKVLLSGAVTSGQTVRLLYHHANGSATERMAIVVNFSNPDRVPAALWVTGAAGNSGADELALGHAAARTFLDQYWHRAGFLLRIPANTSVPLFIHDLAPGAVATGLTQFTLVEGARTNVQVYARLAGEMDPPPMSFAPNFDQVHQRGLFARPQVVRSLSYTVGGQFAMMSVGDGQDALAESSTGRILSGNYGVVYSFAIDVDNPSPLSTILGIVMQAVAGEAGGMFLVDDRVIDVPRVRSGERRLVTTVHLAPGERRTLMISTMPESGGFYPIRLTVGTRYQ